MKKIVMGIAAAALATSMFAAEPAFNAAVTEFNGDASVKWGVNLDTNKTGFKNEVGGNLKFKLFDAGSKETSGDGVWADIKIKSNNDWGPSWKAENGGCAPQGMVVDHAKININKFYVGIMSGDTKVGSFKPTTAVVSDKEWLKDVGPAIYGIKTSTKDKKVDLTVSGTYKDEDVDKPASTVIKDAVIGSEDEVEVTTTDYTQGIVFGYDDSNIGVAVDFRSTDHYTNDYAVAGELTLKDGNEWVTGLGVKAGVAYGLKDDTDLAYAANASYKYAIDDTYYVKPMAGMVGAKVGDIKANMLVASVIFGWGDQADANAGVYFLDDDAAKKVTPGVSVLYSKNLEDTDDKGGIEAAFYLGSLVENLKAAALADIDLNSDDLSMTAKGGVAYDIKSDDLTITAKAGCSAAIVKELKSMKVKAGLDLAGAINNTVFSVEYVSGDLKAETAEKGTIDVGCKISL